MQQLDSESVLCCSTEVFLWVLVESAFISHMTTVTGHMISAGEAADEEQCAWLGAAFSARHTAEGPQTDGQFHVRLSRILPFPVPRQTPRRSHHGKRERGRQVGVV